MNMRISPIAAASIVFAMIALALAGVAAARSTTELPLAIGIMGTAALTVVTLLIHHIRTPTKIGQTPMEDFHLWTKVGEPAAGILGLKPREKRLAASVASADLGLLTTNAELLGGRLSLLAGRHGFDKLTKDQLHKDGQRLAKGLRQTSREVGLVETWSYAKLQGVLVTLEKCASGYDRIGNKLYEFEKERPEIVKTTLEPLRRAAEKLSSGLRTCRTNLESYMKRTMKPPKA